MKYVDLINPGLNLFYKITFWSVVLSTSATCIESVWNFLIFDRPYPYYYFFMANYYLILGADLCAFLMLRFRWPAAPFVMPLFMWILCYRLLFPMPPATYSGLESLVHVVGAMADLVVWVMMLSLIWLSTLRRQFLRRLRPYLKKNPDSTNALAAQAAVTYKAVKTLPKMGLYLSENSSLLDTSRRALLVAIGLMLLLSSVFLMLKWVPTNVKFFLTYTSVPEDILDTGSITFLPALFCGFAAVMIFKKWKPISYLIPLLILFLWRSAFFWKVFEDSMPHEIIAITLGRYTDRALIGLILLNTLLLPIDWFKVWRAKKHQ